MVKITAIKTLQLDNVGDGCLIRIETDSGDDRVRRIRNLTPSWRATASKPSSRALIGQDPLAIERHFYRMSALQYSFVAHIPTISGIDIALWDLAGKILDKPLYQLLGGPMRAAAPGLLARQHREHGGRRRVSCLGTAGRKGSRKDSLLLSSESESVEAGAGAVQRAGDEAARAAVAIRSWRPWTARYFARLARAMPTCARRSGDDIDLAMHCTGQFDTRSAIGLCKAIEPADPLWIEDPLTVNYSEAWLELKRSTRVPLLAGEKVELVRGFRPYLDNQVLDMIHPDVAYSGGITGCKKIADYAALTRTPVGLHSGPCSLIRFYASVHLSGAIQNFFKIENVLGEFRGFKEKMATGKEPVVRKSVMQYPEGPGLGLQINEDWLRQHMAKGETWWG